MASPAGPRPLLLASLAGLAAATLLGTVGAFDPLWATAHRDVGLFGFLMPALAFLHWQVAGPLLPRPLGDARGVAALWLAGGVLLAVSFLGAYVLLAAGLWQTALVMRALPKRGESVVDVQRDPLTKGDDACLKHVKFAHMLFLPLPLAALAAAGTPFLMPEAWTRPVQLSAEHLLLAGYAVLSTYGLSHIAVPRLSGVPAIAAGAIKGELHSSLLGLVLLAAGFLLSSTALLVAGGAFVFLGAFVFMGVLGANIMKNKSPTQRVTPQFAYIPWTFAGVFWLIAGVLLGVFLNAAKRQLEAHNFSPQVVAGLTFTHEHAALLGGLAMLVMGYATRLVPEARGRPPVPFPRTRWAFYGLNVGLLMLAYGRVAGSTNAFQIGALLAAASVAAWFISLLPALRRGETTP